MGLMDSFQYIFEGLILLVIIGGVFVGIWPSLSTYFGNSQVFLVGALILVIAGMIPLVFIYTIIKGIIDKGRQDDTPPIYGGM